MLAAFLNCSLSITGLQITWSVKRQLGKPDHCLTKPINQECTNKRGLTELSKIFGELILPHYSISLVFRQACLLQYASFFFLKQTNKNPKPLKWFKEIVLAKLKAEAKAR